MSRVDESLEERNRETRERMADLTEIRLANLPRDSAYLQPLRMTFIQDGKHKIWDFMKAYDSVVILVFNTSRKKLVFVRQFRPASYCACLPANKRQDLIDLRTYPPTLGLTLELCCGALDKDKSPAEIARDEVREECGYEAPLSDFQKITNYKFIGSTTSTETLFYVEVTDDMNIYCKKGEEFERELIEIIEMSIDEVKNYINSDEVASPASFVNAVSWFLLHKA